MFEQKQKTSFSGIYGVIAALVTCAAFGAGFVSSFAKASEVTELRARQDALDARLDYVIDQIEEIAIQVGAKTVPKPPRRTP